MARRCSWIGFHLTVLAVLFAIPALAQAPARPAQKTTKVDLADGAYIFRNGFHQFDFHPLEAMESPKKIAAMARDRMIPGHPGRPGYANRRPYVVRRYCGLWRRGS